jgi:hypothetical protein
MTVNSTRETQIQAYKKWLDKQSWAWFATLKINSGKPSVRRAKQLFERWIAELGAREGGPDFRFARVLEKGSLGNNPHFHVLIGGLRNRIQDWTERWETLGGEALIKRFDPERGGIFYILKEMDNDGNLDLDISLPKKNVNGSANNSNPTPPSNLGVTTETSTDPQFQNGSDETMRISMILDEKKGTLTITMPIEPELRPSASGKTLVVASTRGLKTGGCNYSGRPVVVVASAFIYPEEKQLPQAFGTKPDDGNSGVTRRLNKTRSKTR